MHEDGLDRALEKASSDQPPEAAKVAAGGFYDQRKITDIKLRENQANLLQSYPQASLN